MKTLNDLTITVPAEINRYTSHSMEISILIDNYIKSVEGMNKKTFAELVGKTSSDITRWLSGSHNFTILTLSLIEVKTGISLLQSLTNEQIEKYRNNELFEFNENNNSNISKNQSTSHLQTKRKQRTKKRMKSNEVEVIVPNSRLNKKIKD